MQLRFREGTNPDTSTPNGQFDFWIEDEFGWTSEKIYGGRQFIRTTALAVLTIIVERDFTDRNYVKYTMVYNWPGHCYRHATGACEVTRMETWMSQTATELSR